MATYSVSKLAKMAGVSVRTLHHYDDIGLLTPTVRTEKGYRQYSKDELYRLQHIMFYKELGLPLKEIQQILDDPDFDNIEALQQHKQHMLDAKNRYEQLILTIDKTIENLKNKTEMSNYEKLYEGFTKEQIAVYEQEVIEQYGAEKFEESKANIAKMTTEQLTYVKTEGDRISKALAALMDKPVSDTQVQQLIKEHHAWIEQFYKAPASLYKGLGDMYVNDARFTASYDKYAKGLAVFLRDAIHYYCEHSMKEE